MKNLICALLISAMPMAQTSESTSEIVNQLNIEFNLDRIQTIYQNHNLPQIYYRKTRIMFSEEENNILIGGNYYEYAEGITQNNDVSTMKAIVGTITSYWILEINNYNNQKLEIQNLETQIRLNFTIPSQYLEENTFIVNNESVLTSNTQWQNYKDLPIAEFNQDKITEMDSLYQNDVYAIRYYHDDNSGIMEEINGNYYLFSGREEIKNTKYLVVKTTLRGSQYNDGLPYYDQKEIQNTAMLNPRLYFEGTTYTYPVSVTQEVIDVPNLMFTILTMPFSFVSQAFNFTLFPNTPYQLNISNLFLAIIGALIMIMIIRIIVKIGAK